MRQHQLLDLSGCFPSYFFPLFFFCIRSFAVWMLNGETMIDSKRQQCGVSAIADIHMKMPDRSEQKHMSAQNGFIFSLTLYFPAPSLSTRWSKSTWDTMRQRVRYPIQHTRLERFRMWFIHRWKIARILRPMFVYSSRRSADIKGL